MGFWQWALIVVGGLLFLAAWAPVHLQLRVATGDAASRFRARWLFLSVDRELAGDRPPPRPDPKPKPPARGAKMIALWRSGLVGHGVRRLRRAVSIREFGIRASVNAGDPAETGMAFAVLGPLSVLLARLPRTSIRIAPDFSDRGGVRGEAWASVRAVPIGVLWHAAAFAMSPTTWRRVAAYRKASRR